MSRIAKILILKTIRIYQKTLSPDHGIFSSFTPAACKYFPTCSQYTYESIARYGVRKGVWCGMRRILRCHPWAQGGYDPVSDRKPQHHPIT